jgi:hypothetical protein
MELLKHVLFEDPLLAYIVMAIATLITAAMWYRTRSRRSRILLAVWPLVAVAVGLLAALVETDREKVDRTWRQVDAAIVARDDIAAMRNIAEDFSADGFDKVELRKLAQFCNTALRPDEITTWFFTIKEIDGRSARATVAVFYNGSVHPFRTDWELTFTPQRDGEWRISKAKCLAPEQFTLQAASSALRQAKGGGRH